MRCRGCSQNTATKVLGLCAACLRRGEGTGQVAEAQAATRREFGLPETIPKTEGGRLCQLCVNECRMASGERGFCGLRENVDGRVIFRGGSPRAGFVQWYYDPLPTNCVAGWVCPECTGEESAVARVREFWKGRNNLAVFYEGCTFNCLFCQNWTYRSAQQKPHRMTAAELAARADDRTACICYFGGDPAAQMPHALRTSEIALERRGGDVRICWETNGSMNPKLARKAAELSLRSGGCVKFDLKAFDETLHRCLTGTSNRQTLANFRMVAEMGRTRRDSPLVIASTLLVPGYLDDTEIAHLAGFIASIDTEIPYSLLGFHPDFFMGDLPTTSLSHAERALALCRDAGLRNVHVGNRHVLGFQDY